MSDTDKAIAITITYLAYRPGVRSKLTDQVDVGMKAQNLEGTRSTGITLREGPDPEDAGPRVTDLTGDTAIRPDRARLLLAELDHAERSLITEAHVLVGHPIVALAELASMLTVLASVVPGRVRSSATVFDRALGEVYGRHKPDPGKTHDGEEGCSACARLKVNGTPWFSPVSYNRGNPTDLGGMLSTKVKLCKPCRDFICRDPEATTYRMPTVEQLKCKRETGKWPKDTEVHRFSAA